MKEVASSSSKPAKENAAKPSEGPRIQRVNQQPVTQYVCEHPRKRCSSAWHEKSYRHQYLSVICSVRAMMKQLYGKLVKQWNAAKNNPPLDHTELTKTFESIRDLNEDKMVKRETRIRKNRCQSDLSGYRMQESLPNTMKNMFRVPFAGSIVSIMESKMNGGLIGGPDLCDWWYSFIKQNHDLTNNLRTTSA